MNAILMPDSWNKKRMKRWNSGFVSAHWGPATDLSGVSLPLPVGCTL